MMRVSVSTAVTAVLALILLLAPRTMLLGALSFLRPPEVQQATRDTSLEALLAAYPAKTFAGALHPRIQAPVLTLSAGPYRRDLQLAEGSEAGVAEGAAVVLDDAGPGLTLVGKVSSVKGESSVVETLSNPAWRSAARIGTSSIDTLVVGGLTPTLTLIPKGAPVAVGDVVFSTDPALPYGLSLGTVAEVRDASDGVLREATLSVPYSLGALRAVSVLRAGN